ncbi:MAG: NYN domain-containing protein [Pigmentiphaga sp.]|uniref:NYN domain-containing protein n=1 Tax=Pigmentiphaga sp. TaxID=1977564 RepID=UPI0029A50722|nr:NYN domain-containing protein [Pigmentiphaga sp.]MDX3906922.1 NYN domain-containing protein [Pigmentiphaga sp.]
MNTSPENVSMALFCDFENVALGVRDAKYERFDIKLVLERLLLKGSIVVKKAYCDWERYKGFKSAMHEANFELIEIPHVRQSGKNSADIRLVVDALDLCYTKSHVNTFVIISGDSDFSPLVSKLRENAKQVIGVGVKQSTSDLLIANCDEFFFYDDLVRETHQAARRDPRSAQQAGRRPQDDEKLPRDELEARRERGIALAVETFDALVAERGDSGKIWASVLKEAIKRRRPDFNESYYGFRAFGNLLEAAQARGLLEFGRDDKSGAYVYRGNGGEVSASRPAPPPAPELPAPAAAEPSPQKRRSTRAASKGATRRARNTDTPAVTPASAEPPPERLAGTPAQEPAAPAAEPAAAPAPQVAGGTEAAAPPAEAPPKKTARKTARKTAPRSRARKTESPVQEG